MSDQQDVDDFLAHYGVLGMKWGVRKDRPGVIRPDGPKASARERFAMNRKGRRTDRVRAESSARARRKKLDSEIAKARQDRPAAKSEIKRAKAQYKVDKQYVGSHAARKVLNRDRDKAVKVLNKASMLTGKEETTQMVLSILVGSLAMLIPEQSTTAR